MGLHAQDGQPLQRRLKNEVHVWPARAHDPGGKAGHPRTVASNGDASPLPGVKETQKANHRGAAGPRFSFGRTTRPRDGDRHPPKLVAFARR
eukprot:14553922-Alexandrium_andersonii.AAC.1